MATGGGIAGGLGEVSIEAFELESLAGAMRAVEETDRGRFAGIGAVTWGDTTFPVFGVSSKHGAGTAAA